MIVLNLRRPRAPSVKEKPKSAPVLEPVENPRKVYELTPEEYLTLCSLRAIEGPAFAFWKRVAARVGVDYTTILSVGTERKKFSGLPVNHGKWWCWPTPLECAQKVKDMPQSMKAAV